MVRKERRARAVVTEKLRSYEAERDDALETLRDELRKLKGRTGALEREETALARTQTRLQRDLAASRQRAEELQAEVARLTAAQTAWQRKEALWEGSWDALQAEDAQSLALLLARLRHAVRSVTFALQTRGVAVAASVTEPRTPEPRPPLLGPAGLATPPSSTTRSTENRVMARRLHDGATLEPSSRGTAACRPSQPAFDAGCPGSGSLEAVPSPFPRPRG